MSERERERRGNTLKIKFSSSFVHCMLLDVVTPWVGEEALRLEYKSCSLVVNGNAKGLAGLLINCAPGQPLQADNHTPSVSI